MIRGIYRWTSAPGSCGKDLVLGRFAGHMDVKFWLDAGIVIQRQTIIVRMIVELGQDRGSAYPAKTPVISR